MHEASSGTSELDAAAGDLIRVLRTMQPAKLPSDPARDLTLGQLRLLYQLRVDGPQPMGQIAEAFDLRPAAATGFVGRVERHGLVERRHRSDDRRIVECALTSSGQRFLDELSGLRRNLIRRALGLLDPAELAEFRTLLGRILERRGDVG